MRPVVEGVGVVDASGNTGKARNLSCRNFVADGKPGKATRKPTRAIRLRACLESPRKPLKPLWVSWCFSLSPPHWKPPLQSDVQAMSNPSEMPWSDNPNAPQVPSWLYLQEKKLFAGFLFGIIFYGVLARLFAPTLPVRPILQGSPWLYSSNAWECYSTPPTPSRGASNGRSLPIQWRCSHF